MIAFKLTKASTNVNAGALYGWAGTGKDPTDRASAGIKAAGLKASWRYSYPCKAKVVPRSSLTGSSVVRPLGFRRSSAQLIEPGHDLAQLPDPNELDQAGFGRRYDAGQ